MSIGKRLLVHSDRDPRATDLIALTADWGCLVTTCAGVDDFRSRLEGGTFDMVLCEDSSMLRRLTVEADPTGDILQTPLCEIEKRHILRVLASTSGNKTRAARILGIDTKTLYNKLKTYSAEAEPARRRVDAAASNGHPIRPR